MWFLIPVAVATYALLKQTKVDNNAFSNDDGLEYRRIYICHSYCDTKSYINIVNKLKLSEDYKVWNHSISRNNQKLVKNDNELREVLKNR